MRGNGSERGWCGHGEGGKEWPYQQLALDRWLFTCSLKGSSTKTEKEAPFPTGIHRLRWPVMGTARIWSRPIPRTGGAF